LLRAGRGVREAGHGELRPNRAIDNVLIEADNEHESGQVEEQFHGLENLEGAGRQAAVKIIDKYHDARCASGGELLKSTLQFPEGRDIQGLRVCRRSGRGQRVQGRAEVIADLGRAR
jgi:hypothetical protein